MTDECTIEELEALLEEDSDDDLVGGHSESQSQTSQGQPLTSGPDQMVEDGDDDEDDDDDIDDDELDRLTALLEDGDNKESDVATAHSTGTTSNIVQVSVNKPWQEKNAKDEKGSAQVPEKTPKMSPSQETPVVKSEPVLPKTSTSSKSDSGQLPEAAEPDVLMKLSQITAMEEQIRLMKAQLLSQAQQISPELAQTVVSSSGSGSTSEAPTTPAPKMKLLEEDIFGTASPEVVPPKKTIKHDVKRDIKQASTEPVRITPSKKRDKPALKDRDLNDSDSDWEELDGEKPAGLSKEGKELKKLVNDGPNKRMAHTPKYDPAEHEPKKKPYNSTWKNRPETSSTTSPNFYNNSQRSQQSKYEKQLHDEKDLMKEPFSGIRIKDPLVSSSSMDSLMSGRKMIRLSRLHTKVGTPDLDSDWVTLAVMVSKTEPRKSNKGNQYAIWRLSDLEDCDKVVSFFLFGKVFQELWKTNRGTVIGLLNASIMPDAEKSKSTEVAITVDNPKKLLLVGKSKDLGNCRSKTKAGNDCSNFINSQRGEYCTYHVQSAYKKTSAKRSELQAGFTGVTPKSFEKKLFNKTGSSVMYGGQMFTTASIGNAGTKNRKNSSVSVKTLQQHHVKQFGPNGKTVTTLQLHDLLPEDKEIINNLKKEDKNEKFHEALCVPSAGSMNYVKHMMTSEQIKEKEKNKNTGQAMQSISAKDFLKSHQQELDARKQAHRRQNKPPSPKTAKASVPTLGKGFGSGGDVLFDFEAPPIMPRVEKTKLKAIAKIQGKGGIKKEDPNALKKEKSPTQVEKVKKRLNESTQEDDEIEEEQPPRKRSKILGDVNLESAEIQKLLKAKSKHDNAVNEQEQERQEQYFSVLEKKEQMEQKMSSTMEVKCKAFSCKQCKYRAMSLAPRCKEEHHQYLVSDGVKRFFECKECKQRTITIDRYPQHRCTKCSGSRFVRCSMFKENKGPKLASEELCLRGEEIKYLNSLK